MHCGKARLVWAAYVKVTGINFKSDNRFESGPTMTIEAIFTPENATNKKVTWSLDYNWTTTGFMSIKSTTATTCTLEYGNKRNSANNYFLTAKSADGVSATCRVSYVYSLEEDDGYWDF